MFYLKMKGDYYRYKAEVATEEERGEITSSISYRIILVRSRESLAKGEDYMIIFVTMYSRAQNEIHVRPTCNGDTVFVSCLFTPRFRNMRFIY